MLLTKEQILNAIPYNQGQIDQGNLTPVDVDVLLALGTAYFQEQYGNLTVDGMAGPATQAALDEVYGRQEVPKGLPSGKGMFIRSLSHTGDSAAEAVDWAQYHGLEWVVIQRIWQYEDKDSLVSNTQKLESYSAAFQAAGIQVWIWGYPTPTKDDEFVQVMYEAVDIANASGIIPDPEAPWLGTKGHGLRLMSKLLAEAGKRGTLVGVTSYGAPWNFSTFPWEEFKSAHFGLPQIYDSKNSLPEDYPTDSVAAWEELGFSIIIPISAAYNKTPEQMEDLLLRTPTPMGALAWWDWYNANQAPSLWEIIFAYDVPSNSFGVSAESHNRMEVAFCYDGSYRPEELEESP